jgi:hypothetical protein
MGAQERMVRVTLLRAPDDNPEGQVLLSGGQVSPLDAIATNISINPADPAFQQPFNKDENVMTYGRRDGPLAKIDMHETIVYELSMKEGERDTLMPRGIAKIHFGDLDLKPGMHDPINPRVTYEVERQRVAQKWGGYQLFPYVRRGANGAIIADIRKIASPRVPHVSIVEVDQRGNDVGDAIDVWTFYHWDDGVDKQAAAEARRRMADDGFQPEVIVQAPAGKIDPADLEAMINAAVEKRLAVKKGTASA